MASSNLHIKAYVPGQRQQPWTQAGTIESSQWEKRKAQLQHMYLEKGMPLSAIQVEMRTHDFDPTIAQYKAKFKKWGFTKRIKSPPDTGSASSTSPPLPSKNNIVVPSPVQKPIASSRLAPDPVNRDVKRSASAQTFYSDEPDSDDEVTVGDVADDSHTTPDVQSTPQSSSSSTDSSNGSCSTDITHYTSDNAQVSAHQFRVAWDHVLAETLSPDGRTGLRNRLGLTESDHIARIPFFYQGIKRESLTELASMAAFTPLYTPTTGDVEAKAFPFILRYTNYLLAVQRNHDARSFLEGSIGELCHAATMSPNVTKMQALERFETVVRLFDICTCLGANISFAVEQLVKTLRVQGLHARARLDLAKLNLGQPNTKEQLKGYKSALKLLEKEAEQYAKQPLGLPTHNMLYNCDLRLAFTVIRIAKAQKLDDDATLLKIWYFHRNPRGLHQPGDLSLYKVVTVLLDFAVALFKREPLNPSSIPAHQDGTKLCLERSRLSAIFEYFWQRWCKYPRPLGEHQALYEQTLSTINVCEVDIFLALSALLLAQSFLRNNRRSATPDEEVFLTSALELRSSRIVDYLFSLTLFDVLCGSFQDDDERDGLAEYLDTMAAHLHRPPEAEQSQPARPVMDTISEHPENESNASASQGPNNLSDLAENSYMEDPPLYEQSIRSSLSDFRKMTHRPHLSASSGNKSRSSASYMSICSLSSSQRYLFGKRTSFGSLASDRSNAQYDGEGDVAMGD